MERIYNDDWKNKSKNIRIGYILLILIGGQVFLEIIGYREIDQSILDMFEYFDSASIAGASGCLFPYIVLGSFSWYLGKREFNNGNTDGMKLMKHSVAVTGFFLITVFIKGLYEIM